MPEWKRLAVYVIPRPGAFAARAAEWLGWDPVEGRSLPHPDLPGLPGPPADLTAEPRRYGFHGTLRAPFRPAGVMTIERVSREVGDLAQRLAPAACDGLGLESIDGFLAFTPTGPDAALRRLAAAVVEGTDALRAPLSEAEMARRGPERLSPRQRSFLVRWGYPFVMEDFRFHLTLTGRLARDEAARVAPVLAAHFAPVLPRPFVVEDLCLCGEDGGGRFHLLDRYALTG
jgi:hypothetical protein